LPKKGKVQKRLYFIPGQVPTPANWGEGCRFVDRCPLAIEKCYSMKPPLFNVEQHQQVACWLVENEGREALENQTINKF
jgi:peptide/nickel transport system ATP-binding protein